MIETNTTRRAVRGDWISLEQLIELTGWTARTVRRKQSAGELVSRAADPGRNGKPRREYDAAALPAEFHEKRMQQRLATGALVKSPGELARPRSDQPIRAMAVLDGDALAQAKERLAIIQPMVDFASSGQKPLAAQQIANLSEIVKYISATQGHSERTLWNWWTAYKSGGPGALADKPRKDRNVSRFFEEHAEAKLFVSNKYLNERLSMTMAHEALEREWPRLRLDANDEAPRYQTTRRFLRSLPRIVTAVLREGEKVYNNDFAPFLVRDISKVPVNEHWISDHMRHDVFVRNVDEEGYPLFGDLPLNADFRPWLTCIVDMRSRAVVGSIWCVNPSSNSISSALRCAMRDFGLPKAFYIDNGKDYKKLGKQMPGLSPDAQGVLVRLGIKSQHCLPKHPQSKQIESFFRTVHKRFDSTWTDVYCGESPARRPDSCEQARQLHKKLVAAGRADESPLPTAREFIDAALAWMDHFNATWKHSGRGMNGRAPQQILDADLPPSSRTPVNPADVAQLFWDRQRRIVSEGGCIQLFNARYEPADAESAAALTLRIKREVLIACDPLSVGEAIALSHDGEFLGHLRAQALLVHGKTSADEIRASLRARRNIFKAVKQAGSRLEQARIAAGDLREIDVLAQRAAVGGRKPVIYSLPVAVNRQPERHMHPDDIAEAFLKHDERPFIDDVVNGFFDEEKR